MKFHGHDAWITCALRFKDRWREQWQPHRFTWLYFYDEAVSFAAGHRPCAECRFKRYKDYQSAWAQATGESPSAKAMNKQLHSERLVRGTHRRRLHSLPAGDLPDGVFVMLDDAPHVLVGRRGDRVDARRLCDPPRAPGRRGHGDHAAVDDRRAAQRLRAAHPCERRHMSIDLARSG